VTVGRAWAHSTESGARPHSVWRRYVDVEHWSDWSRNGVEWARLDGLFEVGTKGKSKAPGMPAATFRLVTVDPDARFVSEVKLPGGRLRFEHVVEPNEQGSRITHRVEVGGLLAAVYARMIGKTTEKALVDGVDRLAVLAAELPASSDSAAA
jgi:hypothetical protein